MAQRRFALILLRSRAEEMRGKAQAATLQIPGPIGEAVAQAHRDAAYILTAAADRLEAEP